MSLFNYLSITKMKVKAKYLSTNGDLKKKDIILLKH